MQFEDLKIIEPILKALKEEKYSIPTSIQEKAIPHLLNRKDVLGSAQTGTGKTAAFAIPILQHLYTDRQQHNKPRKINALIITPTRELAIQIAESFTTYGRHTGLQNTVIFGGVKQGYRCVELSCFHGRFLANLIPILSLLIYRTLNIFFSLIFLFSFLSFLEHLLLGLFI